MINDRLKKQLDFMIEIDKVKEIIRMTYIASGNRRENDAEHSWHLAVMTFLFSEYIDDDVDITKVMKMVLIHDLVEIYAGDTFAFDEKGYEDKEERERNAAEKLFSILPEDQYKEFKGLWEEFEECQTKEAKYGAMLDRLQPLVLNYVVGGGSWKDNNISAEQVYKRNEITLKEGPEEFKEIINFVVNECLEKGYIKK
ncbi:HD domain family protein [Clostridium bornimense]|uniref:HD domain family protein n=1 Tax=Clostridium bornimense TaxID=1216932 RepID=W6SD32_9CLOT|nr:HD domain-containing protein [Clostridium bornimense]CDM67530.1 HD domain family protein [Clostridium bornimense]